MMPKVKGKSVFKMCGRKKKYTQRKANRVAQFVNERQPRQIKTYLCPFCNQHHVGGIKEITEENSSEFNGN